MLTNESDYETEVDIINAADERLYKAKQSERNRVK